MSEKTIPLTPKARAAKRRRSPNYPAVGLENALERATKLYEADGPAGAPLASAVKHIGFSSPHGQAMSVLSALHKFGLTEDKGGRIVPTKLVIDIIEFPPDHERRIVALREAALKPNIYAELVNKYHEHGQLPSDESLQPELIADKGFNPKIVSDFLDDFRKSLEFAGLLRENVLSLSTEDEKGTIGDEMAESGALGLQIPPGPLPRSRTGSPAAESPAVAFDLPRGNRLEIRLRSKISSEEFEYVKKIFSLAEIAFVDKDIVDEK